MNKAKYKDGIKGTLIDIKMCKNGSLRIAIRKGSGHIVNPMMSYKFPKLPSVLAKCNALEGCMVQTIVSNTTDEWGADKFFADIKEVE